MSRAVRSQGWYKLKVRRSGGEFIGPRWVEASREDLEIRMAPRPISPSDRRLLPEGMRTEDSLSVLTKVQLHIERGQANGGGPDRIFYQGVWWRCVGEKPWTENGFRRYVAVRESPGHGGPE